MPNQITNPTAIRTEAMNFDPKHKSEDMARIDKQANQIL